MASAKRLLWHVVVAAIFLRGIYLLFPSSFKAFKSIPNGNRLPKSTAATQTPASILNNLSLASEQCLQIFPGLTKEIDARLERGSFEVERTPSSINGHIQARITRGKVGGHIMAIFI